MKNNLFYYATSELSQDAFICWLSSFALKESSRDAALQECARHLITSFVPELSGTDFSLLDVERQVGHIDVLLTVESKGEIYKIIVEDKTFTSEHDNQLKRYLDLIEASYPGCKARGAYYKTGFQCNLTAVEEAGYTIITREQMLKIIGTYALRTTNQILLDYYDYWSTFQKETERYQTLPVSQWGWKQVNGFYDSLKTSSHLAERGYWIGYDYVANQAGGFYGLWTGPQNYRITINGVIFELYLQLETVISDTSSAQLCLKLCAQSDDASKTDIRIARDSVVYNPDWSYKLTKYGFNKPKRLALGRHMTIGVYNAPMQDHASIMHALDLAIKDYSSLLHTLNE